MLAESLFGRTPFGRTPFGRTPVGRGQGARWAIRLAFFLGAAGVALVLLSNGARRASAQDQNPQRQNKAASAAPSGDRSVDRNGDREIARGKYLVENVAMCGQCHTPRDSKGNFDRTRWLQGGAVPWQPAAPDANWPLLAPRIGGTPPADDGDMIKLLTTGTWTDGKWLRAPMPQFRMERGDAEAVVAYLKSVTPKP